MYAYVVPAGFAALICMVCAFVLGALMRPVRRRYKKDLLPFHRFFAYSGIIFAVLHVLFQNI